MYLGESTKETQRNGLIHLLAARSHNRSNKLLMLNYTTSYVYITKSERNFGIHKKIRYVTS